MKIAPDRTFIIIISCFVIVSANSDVNEAAKCDTIEYRKYKNVMQPYYRKQRLGKLSDLKPLVDKTKDPDIMSTFNKAKNLKSGAVGLSIFGSISLVIFLRYIPGGLNSSRIAVPAAIVNKRIITVCLRKYRNAEN